MDFAAMKRRELQALCKRHGLAGGGTNANLVARLTATLSGSGGAAEEAVGVVVGKGCLKRSAGGASGGDLDAKKVTFELEEDEEAEVGVSGRGRRRSQVLSSPAVPKTRGRQKAGEAPPAAKGKRGRPRLTRSQAGGDSADESDSAEAGADAPVRRPGRNAVNLGAGGGAEMATRKNPTNAEKEEVDVGDAVGSRKHQLKRKTRENDIEDGDVSGQVGVSRRSTRSSSHLLEPDALSSPVQKKRGRRKAADVKEKTLVEEQPTEAPHSGRTLRSGVVVFAQVPPIVSESKKSRCKVQEEEPAVEKVAKVVISGRATRSSSVAPAMVQEKEPAAEKVAKVEISGRATRSSSVAPAVVQEEKHALEKVAKVEISGRATRSSSVAPSVTSPRVNPKKRGRKTDDVHFDEGPDKKMENKRQSSRLTTRSSIQHLASSGDEPSLEQVDAPSKGLPPRRSRRNPSEANMMLNSNTTSESSNRSRAQTEFSVPKIARPTMPYAAKDGVEDGVENPCKHVGLKKSKLRNVSATVATNGGEIPFSGKASVTDVQIELPGPVRRSTRKSVVPSSLELETNAMHVDIEKKQTVTKPVGRSTRRSVAPDIFEKESKGLMKEIVPEANAKRPTRKSVVPAMLEKGRKGTITEIIPEARVKKSTRKPALPTVNSENNDHSVVVRSENLQSDKSQELEKPTVKKPVRRVTRKSAVPATTEKDRKGVPDMLNNENGDRTEMQSDKVGHLEKLVVKEPVRRPTGKSVVPDVIEKEKTGLQEELKSEFSVRTPVCKSSVPNVVNKDSKDDNAFVRREELSVNTRSAHTRLQVALQNDESLRRTTRKSSKLAISPQQSKPTASKGRPAKRRRTSSLQEDMPAEEQREDQIAEGVHTNDVIEVAASTDLEIGVLPFAAEKSDLQDPQLNSELEGKVVVEPGLGHDEDTSERLEIESEGTVGTTEKLPSNLPILECKGAVAVSEEAVNSIENDGSCSPNFEQSSTGLQFLFSQGSVERSDAIPCPENSVEQSDVHKVECRVETVVSSKPDSYQGSDENSVGVEESGGLMFSSQQNNEQEVFSVSSPQKDLVASALLDPSEDVDRVARDVITEDLICKEKEKKDFIPSSDINVPHEVSLANEPAENASGVSGAVFRISQCTPISDEVNSDSSRLESPDNLDNRIASSNTEASQQDNEEEFNVHNGVTQNIHASGMSEAAQVEVSKCGNTLLPDPSAFRDAQLNLKQEGNEFEEQSFSCGEDGSGKINMSPLANEYVTDFCHEQDVKLPHDLSAVKSPKGSITCPDEFVIASGIGQTSESMVKGNDIAMDAPGGAKQGDNRSPSANAMLRNRENTPACKIDAPELSSDHMFTMDLSAQTVQRISGRPREAGLAVGNPDNKMPMEQVQQDDAQVLEENTAVGSASNQQYGLSEEAEPQSLKNERCSSTVEKSPTGLQSLLLQNDLQVQKGTPEKTPVSATPVCKQEYRLPDKAEPDSLKNAICSSSVMQSLFSQDDEHVQEGTLEKAALESVTPGFKHECGLPDEAEPVSLKNERCSTSVEQSPFVLQPLLSPESEEEPSENVALAVHAKNGVDESKDIHVGYGVEKPPLPESVSDHDSNVDFSAVSKSEDCAYTSDQGLTKSCHGQEQMVCQPGMLEAANCMKDFTNPKEVSYDEENKKSVHSTEISSSCESLHANGPVKHASGLGDGLLSSSPIASTDDTDVHPGSNRYQFESTDFLNERCNEPKENQVTYGSCSSDVIEADTAKDLGSEVPSLPAEETSNMEYLFLGESSKESDMHGDLVLPSAENEDDSNTGHVEQQVENMVSSEPDSSKGSDMHGDLVLQSAENEDDSITYHVKQQVEKVVSSEPESHQGSNKDSNIVEEISGCMLSSQLEHEKDEKLTLPLLAAETPALLDEQANPELEAGESEKCSFSSEDTSGKIDTGHMKNYLFQLHEDSHMDPIKDKELPNDLPAPKSPEQSTAGQDAETSASPDEQPNPEQDSSEFEERNLSDVDPNKEKELYDVPAPKPAETSASPDEQPSPELDSSEFDERNISHMDPNQGKKPYDVPAQPTIGQNAETSSPDEQPSRPELDSSEFEEWNLSPMDPNQGKELPDDVLSPKAPAQSTIGQDAETSALPDDQPNPELDLSEFEERNLSHMDPNQGKELPYDVPAPKSPAQFTIGLDAETSVSPDEQPRPELDSSEFEERNLSPMDPNQGKELPDDILSPKAPAQSTIGQDAETSASPDEQPNPELDSSKFEEWNISHMDPNQGKELPYDVPVPKSSAQSTIGQDAETSASPDEQPSPELDLSELEERNLSPMDPNQGKDLPDDVLSPKAPAQSTIGQDPETSSSPELDSSEVAERYISHMDPNQGKELPYDVPVPKSSAQSTIGQDAETSASPDEQPSPELDSSELEERNLSPMDPNQGKELPDDVLSPRAPAQSTIGQDPETSSSPDDQPNPELDSSEVEERDLSSEDTSGIFGTGYVKTTPFQFHEDSHTDSNQGKELPADVPASKSPAESTIVQDGETSASLDEQPNNLELDLSEFEERLFQFHGDSHMDPIQGKGLPDDLPATKSPEQPTIGKDAETSAWSDEQLNPEFGEGNFGSEDTSGLFGTGYGLDNLFKLHEEEYNDEHNDDQAAAAMLSSGMTKPTLTEGSGSGMALLSAAGTPALTDEQLNSKLEVNEEHSFYFDEDNSYVSATGLVGKTDLSSLPEDTCMETCFEQELPIGTPAAKSSGESVVFGDSSVPGSAGTCQTSGRRRIDEISKQLLSFKISSAVKGSYIAMDSAKAKQGDNPSRISLLGNTENVPTANPDDPAELNPDWLDVKESPRQGNTDGL